MPLRVVFFGTPDFAVPSLAAIARSTHTVVGVVTQPDRPRGRGQRVMPPPVKVAATELGVDVLQPSRVRESSFIDQVRTLRADVAVVAAYGRILTAELLEVPRLGFINVHASLLPRWRGAAPVHRAILAGDEASGVTIMRVVLELDAGPMMLHESTPIAADETSVNLEHRLARMGGGLCVRALDELTAGTLVETPQDASLVTYAAKLKREDGRVDFTRRAREVHNQIRGLHPWPLAAARLHDRRLRLLESRVRTEAHQRAPGTVIRVEPEEIVVATGDEALGLRRVQLDGRPAMAVRDFLNGHQVFPGDQFTPDVLPDNAQQ